ncbi:MAG: creatininase family protein [Paracoccaceae bacterium]
MTRRLDWSAYRSAEFAECDPERTIAILPTAAIEQHGPHLPVGTDAIIAEGMLAQVRLTLPDDLDVRILPVQAVGKSNEHLYAAGTLTLSATTAISAWTEIGLSVARAGIKKIVFVNSHGGNGDVNAIVARELRVQAGMLAALCSWGSFGTPEGLLSDEEWAHGLHGGDAETSLILALAPGSVDMTKAEDFRTSAHDTPVPPTGGARYAWIATDLHPSGTVGEASKANADKGRALIEHQVAGFIEFLRDVQRMSVPGTS